MTEPEDVIDAASALRVVRGDPDEAELAALVAGVVAMASVRESERPGSPTSAWMDRARSMRGHRIAVLGKGPSAWRHSLR